MTAAQEHLLEVRNLKTYFYTYEGTARAVDGVSYHLDSGEALGMMISIGKDYVYAGMWWMVVFPGATLIAMVVGINLFADWLREELNPKL